MIINESGVNTHLPAVLMFTKGLLGFDPKPHDVFFVQQNVQLQDLFREADFISWNTCPSLAAHTHQPHPLLGESAEGSPSGEIHYDY